MLGLLIFIVSGAACLYLFGFIKGPSLPVNFGAGIALGIVAGLISIAGLIGAGVSLFR